jgi:radical SAM protein with 4Fe4S-binding SPASM domain
MVRFTAYRKYLYYLQHFATPKKLHNILLNKSEQKNKLIQLKSKPYKITLDPGNVCNLKCPCCHTGIKHAEMIKPTFLTFKNYKVVFENVKDYALSVALYNWGEPLLNKEIFDIIDYTTANKVGSTLHSNFNYLTPAMAENLVKSKLTHIYLSIDGASQEVYSKYRVKGNYEKVLGNIELLVDAKKKAKSKFPFITWKYLTFPFNIHEVEAARTKAEQLGVDNFEVFTASPHLMDIYDEAEKISMNSNSLANTPEICSSLWSSLYVGPDGTVFPCSLSFRKSESFGNLLDEKLSTIWNNSSYHASRQMFSTSSDLDAVPLPCKGCKYFIKCSRKPQLAAHLN